eukprot:SAG22_NODE_1896_length_3362_cov_3.255899_1_plen_315_part_00
MRWAPAVLPLAAVLALALLHAPGGALAGEIGIASLSTKTLKKLFADNRLDCSGCADKEDWVDRAEEALEFGSITEDDIKAAARKKKKKAKGGGPDTARAPDGGLEMTKAEFTAQLMGSMNKRGQPPIDQAMVDNMWESFSDQIRKGEIDGAGGGGLFGVKQGDWGYYIQWSSMVMVLIMLMLRKRERDQRRAAQGGGPSPPKKKFDNDLGDENSSDDDSGLEADIADAIKKIEKDVAAGKTPGEIWGPKGSGGEAAAAAAAVAGGVGPEETLLASAGGTRGKSRVKRRIRVPAAASDQNDPVPEPDISELMEVD